jgi:hypothetical protein
MLPLSRPLFAQQDDRHLTLAVVVSLFAATVVVLATLTGVA